MACGIGWKRPDNPLPTEEHLETHLRDIHETGPDLDKNIGNVPNIPDGIPAKSKMFSSHPQVS